MRLFPIALFLALSTAAIASGGKTVVTCGTLPFSDLAKIEIRRTDLADRYQIVETTLDSRTRKETARYTATFGAAEIEKGEFPELSAWNGYARTLGRYGRDRYFVSIEDECGRATLAIDCRESF